MRGKKGQAAMEFLMTYGWAILAAVIVIGVLASFGVFSPSKYVPTSCVLSAPLGCDKNQVAASSSTGDVTFILRNGGGESLNITSIAIEGCTTNSTNFIVADGDIATSIVDCTGALTSGEKFTGDVTVTYIVSGGSLSQSSSGSITVEAA